MKKMLFIMICILLGSGVYAQPKEEREKKTDAKEIRMRIVITDLKPKNVSKVIVVATTDLIRSEIVDTKRFDVLERSQVDKILKEQEFQQTGCTDSACAVEMGKLLSANKVLLGEVNKLGAKMLITVRIVDVQKGTAEFSASEKADSVDGIEYAVKKLVNNLTLRMTGQPRTDEAKAAFDEYERKKAEEEKLDRRMRSPRLRFGGSFGRISDGGKPIPLASNTNQNANAVIDIIFYRFRDRDSNGFDILGRGGLQHRQTTMRTVAEIYDKYGFLGNSSDLSMNRLSYWRASAGLGARYAYGFYFLDTSIQGYVLGLLQSSTYSFDLDYQYMSNNTGSKVYTALGVAGGGGIEVGRNDFGVFVELTYGYDRVGPRNLNLEGMKLHYGATWRTSYR